jgi:putative hydrolase of the HAD superfamily
MVFSMKPLENIVHDLSRPMEPLPTDTAARLIPLQGIKAVLFDVYGTLFISGSGDVGTAAATDTADAMTQALEAAHYKGDLRKAGELGKDRLKAEVLEWHAASRAAGTDFPEVDITRIWKKVVGRLRKDGILTPPRLDIEPIRKLALEYECLVNPVWPMPECLETLHYLKDRGYVMGIVSNAQFYTPMLFRAFFEQTLEEIGFDPDCCIWSYKELKAKPSADLFPRAEQHLKRNHGITLSETVYVGNDMLNDIHCAHAAGCKTVLFAGDRRSLRMRETDERCVNLKPDAIITALGQLPDLIQ